MMTDERSNEIDKMTLDEFWLLTKRERTEYMRKPMDPERMRGVIQSINLREAPANEGRMGE